MKYENKWNNNKFSELYGLLLVCHYFTIFFNHSCETYISKFHLLIFLRSNKILHHSILHDKLKYYELKWRLYNDKFNFYCIDSYKAFVGVATTLLRLLLILVRIDESVINSNALLLIFYIYFVAINNQTSILLIVLGVYRSWSGW